MKRRMSREHACHCAGPGSPTMGLRGWVCREGQAVLSKGLPSVPLGHLHLFIYSVKKTNTRVSSLCHGHARNGGIELVFGSQVKKQGGSQVFQERPHSVMGAMVGSGKRCLNGASIPPRGRQESGRLPGESDAWRVNRSQPLHVCAHAHTHWAWEGRGAGSRQRVPL